MAALARLKIAPLVGDGALTAAQPAEKRCNPPDLARHS
jgi:hypothetical protein